MDRTDFTDEYLQLYQNSQIVLCKLSKYIQKIWYSDNTACQAVHCSIFLSFTYDTHT